MSDFTKINTTHLSRRAYVYLRQSSPAQVEHNRESTARQYALVAKAAELGWPEHQVLVIDEDLGVSGSGVIERSGFARLTADVALGHVGIVLGLEVSRLARNNHQNLLRRPPELRRLGDQCVLARGRFAIVLDLCRTGLSEIDISAAGEMRGVNLGEITHRPSRFAVV